MVLPNRVSLVVVYRSYSTKMNNVYSIFRQNAQPCRSTISDAIQPKRSTYFKCSHETIFRVLSFSRKMSQKQQTKSFNFFFFFFRSARFSLQFMSAPIDTLISHLVYSIDLNLLCLPTLTILKLLCLTSLSLVRF